MDTADINEYVSYSPLFAATTGKDDVARQDLLRRFDSLPESVKDMLTAPATTGALKEMEAQGILPSSHVTAIGKILFLAALGDIPFNSIGMLLEKLNLSPGSANTVNTVLTRLLSPVIAARAKMEVLNMKEMPPMTRPTETGPKPLSPQVPDRNIIDLRKQQPHV